MLLLWLLFNVLYPSFCVCIRAKQYLFLNSPPIATHHGNLRLNLFEEAEIEAANPRVPFVEKKPRPIYNLDDPLAKFRIQNFALAPDSSGLNLTSLPFVQIEHQDKNSLIAFKDGRAILAFYANKLNSFLSNFKEWTKAYDPEPMDPETLEIYNPIAPNSYYALVFYCSWQSESIALVRAVKQLLGAYRFIRDPPIENRKKKKKPPKMEEMLEEYRRLEPQLLEYRKRVEEARKSGLPDPPCPDFHSTGPVKFNLHVPDVDETLRILEHSTAKYGYNWLMPRFGKLTYNRLVDKAFNELYHTSYSCVRTPEERTKYKLLDLNRDIVEGVKRQRVPINVNFVFVRLANSLMISNTKQALKRHKKFVQSHEKEFKFNEIMLRLLLEQEIYYENMPAIQFFKCVEPLDSVPSVYGSKTHANMPFDEELTFYKRDPFEIAAHVNYGLPTLRKCNHLSVSDDFVHLGNLTGFAGLRAIDSFEDLFRPSSDFADLFTKKRPATPEDLARIEPVVHALTLMYKFHLKRIIDARPVEPEYLILNP